jgi:hypothetical protein
MRNAMRDKQGRPVRAFSNETSVDGRRVELRFAIVEDRLVCIGLEIGPPVLQQDEGPHVFDLADEDAELDPLRSTEIRLPLRELVDRALEYAARAGIGLKPETVARFERHRSAARKGQKKPGRPAMYDDDHYRKIANLYTQTLESGRRDPLRRIMAELKIEKTTAASQVREARRRGFLTVAYPA